MICDCRFIDFNRIYTKLVSHQGTKIKLLRIDDPQEDRIHGTHRGRPEPFGRSRSFAARRTNGGAALYNFVYKSKWKLDLLVLLCSVGFARPPLKTRGSRMPVKKRGSRGYVCKLMDEATKPRIFDSRCKIHLRYHFFPSAVLRRFIIQSVFDWFLFSISPSTRIKNRRKIDGTFDRSRKKIKEYSNAITPLVRALQRRRWLIAW